MVADTIQQRWCTLDSLAAEVASGPVRGSAWLRRSLTEAIGGIRSGAEGDLSDLLRRSGLPVPMFNARLYIGQTFVAVADAWWAEAGWSSRWIRGSGICRPKTGSARSSA